MGREEGGRLEGGGGGPGAVRYNGRLLSSTTNFQCYFKKRLSFSYSFFPDLHEVRTQGCARRALGRIKPVTF